MHSCYHLFVKILFAHDFTFELLYYTEKHLLWYPNSFLAVGFALLIQYEHATARNHDLAQ